MKDHPATQAALIIMIVTAGIILEKWLITMLPNSPVTNPLKKLINYL